MQTLVVRIPDHLARELEAEALKKRLSKSEVARRRLMAAGEGGGEHLAGYELIADLVGSIEGGPSDMSAEKKKFLRASGYGQKRDR